MRDTHLQLPSLRYDIGMWSYCIQFSLVEYNVFMYLEFLRVLSAKLFGKLCFVKRQAAPTNKVNNIM